MDAEIQSQSIGLVPKMSSAAAIYNCHDIWARLFDVEFLGLLTVAVPLLPAQVHLTHSYSALARRRIRDSCFYGF
ncbi:hypothetical protein RvY_16370 [Ramazzottius varieornatus]|uniref:Uncharacterized protein n=1 Tax=Ramazzottius varieornatus TaxID=947166 RepID=A0A1D1VZ41_RAMVA|nr:hypothetical protein RvY_16370 [Ramazzottius varieornatus]